MHYDSPGYSVFKKDPLLWIVSEGSRLMTPREPCQWWQPECGLHMPIVPPPRWSRVRVPPVQLPWDTRTDRGHRRSSSLKTASRWAALVHLSPPPPTSTSVSVGLFQVPGMVSRDKENLSPLDMDLLYCMYICLFRFLAPNCRHVKRVACLAWWFCTAKTSKSSTVIFSRAKVTGDTCQWCFGRMHGCPGCFRSVLPSLGCTALRCVRGVCDSNRTVSCLINLFDRKFEVLLNNESFWTPPG